MTQNKTRIFKVKMSWDGDRIMISTQDRRYKNTEFDMGKVNGLARKYGLEEGKACYCEGSIERGQICLGKKVDGNYDW